MQEISMSLKIHNYNYAPGISTYGLPGKDGSAGIDGNNIYFTTYLLVGSAAEEIIEFIQKIKDSKLPIKNQDTLITRPYKNGDMFVDLLGRIFTIIDIDKFMLDEQQISETDITKLIRLIGKIHIDDTSIFKASDTGSGRIILNLEYKGIDVVDGIDSKDALDYIDTNTTMNIVSTKIDNKNNINLIQMSSLYNTLLNNDMLIYFDTTDNSYHLSSDYPIVLNGNVTVNYKKSETLLNNVSAIGEEYSKVIVDDNSDSITRLRQILSKVSVTVKSDDNIKIELYMNSDSYGHIKNILNSSYIKVYTNTYCWMFPLSDAEIIDDKRTITITCNQYITDISDIVSLSFMHNVEIMLKI